VLEPRFHPPPAPPVKGGELKPSPPAGEGRVRGALNLLRRLGSTRPTGHVTVFELQTTQELDY
jgi:hypothetical protein